MWNIENGLFLNLNARVKINKIITNKRKINSLNSLKQICFVCSLFHFCFVSIYVDMFEWSVFETF